MDINFGEIYFYSHDPEKLFHFLTFLFDVEADDYHEHNISFVFKDIMFVVRQADTKRIDKTNYFSLKVQSASELVDLKRNIEFYYYKEGNKKFKTSIEGEKLRFTDPDGRQWSVYVGKANSLNISSESSYQENVRNF